MWLAILLTVLASTGNNVGKALQKQATRVLPRFSLDLKIVQQYLRSRQWLLGLGADLGGALLMIAAFALAPVSVVQPVSGVGLVTLAVFSHFYLKETLQRGEWGAVGVAALGTIGLGATADDGKPPAPVSTVRLLATLLAMVLLVGLASAVHYGRRGRQRSTTGVRAEAQAGAYMFGLQAGCCFGLSAAACRAGFLFGAKRTVWILCGVLCSTGLTSAGFVLQTCGLKDGNSVIVCTCAAVSSMVTGVAVGLLALGETMPSGFSAGLMRLLSWALIALGVAGIAHGKGGVKDVMGLVLASLPKSVLAWLPASVAVSVRNYSRKYVELPTIDPAGISLSAARRHTPKAGVHFSGPFSNGPFTTNSPRTGALPPPGVKPGKAAGDAMHRLSANTELLHAARTQALKPVSGVA